MTHVRGEGVAHTDMWMRMCVLMALGQLHSIHDPLVQTKQHLQDLVPRHSWLAQLPQHHSPSPSSSTLLRVSGHTSSGRAGKRGVKARLGRKGLHWPPRKVGAITQCQVSLSCLWDGVCGSLSIMSS